MVSELDLPASPTPEQVEIIQNYLKVQHKNSSSLAYGKANYYQEKQEIIGKKLIIFKHKQKKKDVWYMRLYVGNKKYKTLSLKTSEYGLAVEKALDKWRTIQNHIDTGATVFEQRINETFDSYFDYLQEMVTIGKLKKLTLTCKITSLKKLKLYLHDYELPSQIPSGVLDNYIQWRRTKNWDKSKHKNNPKPPADQTINRELFDFKGYFDWLKRKKNYTQDIDYPFLKIDWRKSDEKNPSFEIDDWMNIVQFTRKWVKKTENRKEFGIFYRKLFCEYLKVLANSGLRPHEALLLRWTDIILKKKEEVSYREVKNFGNDYSETEDLWGNFEDTHSEVLKSFEFMYDEIKPNTTVIPTGYKSVRERLIAHIQVSPDTKTGRRLVICPAGTYFHRIKNLYKEKLGSLPKPNDFVFMNIGTSHSREMKYVGHAITTDHFRKLWYELISDLRQDEGIIFDNHYTIYSCRSFFINQRLEMGVEPHFVAKLVGHSLTTMERHYEDIQLKRIEPELVEVRRRKLEDADFQLYDF